MPSFSRRELGDDQRDGFGIQCLTGQLVDLRVAGGRSQLIGPPLQHRPDELIQVAEVMVDRSSVLLPGCHDDGGAGCAVAAAGSGSMSRSLRYQYTVVAKRQDRCASRQR